MDDDALVRLGLDDLLGEEPDVEVVAQAADGFDAIEKALAVRVDVAILDLRMPRMDGIAVIPRLRALPRPPRTIALTTFDLDECVYSAIASGADGFMLKDTAPRRSSEPSISLRQGRRFCTRCGAGVDRPHYTVSQVDRVDATLLIEKLTPRECDVLRLLARGDTNADIAVQLGMRESTVKSHVS